MPGEQVWLPAPPQQHTQRHATHIYTMHTLTPLLQLARGVPRTQLLAASHDFMAHLLYAIRFGRELHQRMQRE